MRTGGVSDTQHETKSAEEERQQTRRGNGIEIKRPGNFYHRAVQVTYVVNRLASKYSKAPH
jgi:hypothetical protein